MSTDINEIGSQKVKSVTTGESVELRSFWQDQNVAIVFFRRWGCMLCRLWAKELSEIAPVLKKNNVKLVGVGVEELGSKDFLEGKYFDGDLYYVENQSTYQTLGFKRFNVFTIITSLFWKQSRDAIFKGRGMALKCFRWAAASEAQEAKETALANPPAKRGLESDLVGDGLQNGGVVMVKTFGKVLNMFVQAGPADHMPNIDIIEVIAVYSLCLGGDLKGDWVQTGGALLVQKGGNLLKHFVQTGPGDHLPNLEILKNFGLENEYKQEIMENKTVEQTTEAEQ